MLTQYRGKHIQGNGSSIGCLAPHSTYLMLGAQLQGPPFWPVRRILVCRSLIIPKPLSAKSVCAVGSWASRPAQSSLGRSFSGGHIEAMSKRFVEHRVQTRRPARPEAPNAGTGGAPQPGRTPERASDTKPGGQREIGGPEGPEPTRFGDWERKGICVDF